MSQLEAMLHGMNHLETVDLSAHNGPEEVRVRPLSSAEASKVESAMVKGLGAEATISAGLWSTPVPSSITSGP